MNDDDDFDCIGDLENIDHPTIALPCWGRMNFAMPKLPEIYLPSYVLKNQDNNAKQNDAWLPLPHDFEDSKFSVYDTELVDDSSESELSLSASIPVTESENADSETSSFSVLNHRQKSRELETEKTTTKHKKRKKQKQQHAPVVQFEMKKDILSNTNSQKYKLEWNFPQVETKSLETPKSFAFVDAVQDVGFSEQDFPSLSSKKISRTRRLVLTNIPRSIEKKELTDLLEPYGKIHSLELIDNDCNDNFVAYKIESDGDLEWMVDCLHGNALFETSEEPVTATIV